MVINVLKDGTVLPDISGHIVKEQDALTIYNLMDEINKGERDE